MRLLLGLSLLLFTLSRCDAPPADRYHSETLQVEPIAPGVFQHVSYLAIPEVGPYPCNGMIVMEGGEALVFDTPPDDRTAAELLDWLTQAQGVRVKAVVVNHFHDDCLGGLGAFHARGIPSYAYAHTVARARTAGGPVPAVAFADSLRLSAGGLSTLTTFLGEGHTVDNVVSYVPAAQTLFGGCLIKADQASKGNLADANVAQWSQTVRRVMARFPEATHIIPGHGAPGGRELLQYTVDLFAPAE